MKYKIVTSGKTEEVTLAEISRNLKPSSEIYALSDREIYLGPISHRTLVLFITEFADYALQNYTKRKIIPEAETCIRLTRKWLEDRESVSNDELRAAAYAADAAAYAAADAADAAYAAAYVADSASYAANAAAYAAANAATYAATYAAGVDKDKELIRQGEFILDFLKNGKHLFLV
jgi:hypothetical protein